jgi:ribonucleoside-diphosphate reductase alpha chain
MVGAVQPFVSGAISKTFNMANETTKEEIEEAYMMSWKLGIKAFAVYRDGSKATQPLSTSQSKTKEKKSEPQPQAAAKPGPYRRRLPSTRPSETHKFSVVGHEGYITYSMYEDGTIAELFVRIAKQGSTLSGLLDAFAVTVSMALQYGVPLKTLAHKFIHTRFEPAGFTENPDIRIATSILDYIFRYLALRFLDASDLAEFGMVPSVHGELKTAVSVQTAPEEREKPAAVERKEAAKLEAKKNGYAIADTMCRKCGGMMVRSGTCFTCLQCGDASGGCS